MPDSLLRVKVQDRDLEAFKRKLQPDKLVAAGTRPLFLEAQRILKKAAEGEAPRDTGNLAKRHVARLDPRPVPLWTTITNTAPYAQTIYDGRRPGSRMPPPSALTGWLRRHGIPERAAFVVARAIGRRGTKANRWLERAFQKTESQVLALRAMAAKQIEEAFNRG